MSKKKLLKFYLCGTDLTELGVGANDVRMYSSERALRESRSCIDECGVVRVTIAEGAVEVLQKSKYNIRHGDIDKEG